MIDAKQYLKNKERLIKAEKDMDEGDKWNNPKYIHWIEEYSNILEANLEFEKFHKIGWASSSTEKKDDENK